MDDKELMAKLQEISVAMCFEPASVGIGQEFAARLKNTLKLVGDESGVTTMAVNSDGLMVNRGFLANLHPAEAVFVVAHETMHVAAGHLFAAVDLGIASMEKTENGATVLKNRPGMERNNKLHNVATDVWINETLQACKVGRPPKGVLFLDSLPGFTNGKQYGGKLASEDIYHWLVANAPEEEQGGGGPGDKPGTPIPGTGCGPEGLPPSIDKVASDSMRANIREQALGAGKGSAPLANALVPPKVRVDWRSVLRHAMETANDEAQDRSERSFSRASRREIPDIIMPGLIGTEARLAVVIDVSGSVGPAWAARAVAYIERLSDAFPGSRVFLATHTDCLCWSGWVTPGTDTQAIIDSTKFSGGTDAAPAYDAVRATKAPFDVLVHFTDCDLPGWPACPAKRQVVGVMCRSDRPSGLPSGARTVFVTP